MAKCSDCRRDIVEVTHGQIKRLLDPTPLTYVTVDEHHIYPEDGDRVVLSTALVEHHAVCPAALRAQAQQREAGKAAYARQKGGRP